MRTHVNRFNVFFAVVAMAVGLSLGGCKSDGKEKKPLAMLTLHMETNPTMTENNSTVPIYRENPMMLTVDKNPFITEADLITAKIVDVMGGFAIQLKFDDRATWTIEQYTASYPGKRIAILCRWDTKLKEVRWLGAPITSRRISNGMITFTPDATREEAEKIVLGLNNMSKEAAKRSEKW